MTELPTRVAPRAQGSSVHGSIDTPAAGAELALGPVWVSGWAFDEAGPIEAAMLIVGDGPVTAAQLGRPREDVGAAFPAVEHAGTSGFECGIDLRAAGSATVRIALLVRTAARGWEEAAAVAVRTTPSTALEAGRRRAAFTIVKNEPVMLPIWLDYYGRYFEPGDLFVLDHGSTDGSTSGLGERCRVVPVHRDAAFDHRWLRSTVEAFQSFLLGSYAAVLFAEVDELVVADPRSYAGLDAYIERLDRPAARCVGFNVVQQPGEAPLRFDAPLLEQRRYWHASQQYSKRLLARMPLRWSEGFHTEFNAPDDPPDAALMLVHLHRIDYNACLQRHRAAAAVDWNEDDVRLGYGAQNRIADPVGFDDWFRQGPDLDTPGEPIPERVRGLL